MRRLVLFCLAALLFCVAGTGWADVQSIRSALGNGENQKALDVASAAGSETPEIMHLIAIAKLRLLNQRSIANPDDEIWRPGEREEIEVLLKSAADQGYGPAMREYGFFLAIGSEVLPEKSLLHLKAAMKTGDYFAAITLYNLYCSGATDEVSIVEVDEALRKIAASSTDSDSEPNAISIFGSQDDDEMLAQLKLTIATNLATGGCGNLDKQEARQIFDGLWDLDDSFGMRWNLGSIVRHLKGDSNETTRFPVAKNSREALDWLKYKVGLGLGTFSDYTDYAEAALSGKDMAQDFAAARVAIQSCYRDAKKRDEVWCFAGETFDLALQLMKSGSLSRFSSKDVGALTDILSIIAKNDAKNDSVTPWLRASMLGDAYYNGDFGSKDFKQALVWYKIAAEAGSILDQFQLGYMYSNGEGTAINSSEAIRYYRLAASNGVGVAAYNLGWMYAFSSIVPKDEVEATRWYKRGAELGDLDSTAMLGKRLSEGTGTLENDIEAVRWLTKAAEAGQKFAQKDLAYMYANGEGVDQNFVAAYKWANLAGGKGVDVSAIKSWLSARMNRDEVTRAQSLSAAWKPTPVSDAPPKAGASNGSESIQPVEPDELTLEVQVGLSELGLLAGSADGLFGPKTRAAIEAFQRQQGLPVTGVVSPQLATQIGRALAAAPATKSRPYDADGTIATGTGFVVSSSGHLVTNAHVVTGCQKVTLGNGKLLTMQAYDPVTDLALLKSSALEGVSPLFLRGGSNVEVAESVAVAGFPLSGLVSPDLNVTLGNVSALSGPDGSKSLIQITAPVQPGNSGGPILDEAGSVVGVVVSKLDAIAVATITGDIPQNVNFGISLSELKAFLNKQGVPFSLQAGKTVLKSAKVGELARASTFQVQCH